MIVFKNNAGFTLIETMLAITLIAIVMTPLLVTQGSVAQAVAQISERLQRVFFAENFFIEAHAQADDEKNFSLDKKLESLDTRIIFERNPVNPKSSLAHINNLVHERIQASWQEGNKQQKEVLISFRYNKPQSKS